MKHRFTITFVLLLCLGLTTIQAQEKKSKKAKPVTIPFTTLPSGHMMVEVKLNGKGPFNLIFDTGAPINLINNKIAKAADLLKDVPKPLFQIFGTMGEVKIKELQVGSQKIDDVPAIVMDHPTVGAISKAFEKTHGEIDGIVGFPFFARFRMTLDYKAKTMTITPSGFNPPNVLASMQAALLGSLGGNKAEILTSKAKWGMIVEKGSDDKQAGVTVTKVLPSSPAARAGIQKGDRLLTLDGRWTDTVDDTFLAAGFVKPGETIQVKIKRDGKTMSLKVTPAAGF